MSEARENELSRVIVGSAIEVHRQLGPGLLESAYEVCMVHELQVRGVAVERQKPIGIAYKGMLLDAGFRIDLLVEQCVVVELKAVEAFAPIHEAQMLTYLRLTGCKLGLLLNFNVTLMKNGIKRLALGL